MRYPFKIVNARFAERKNFDFTSGKQSTYAMIYLKKGSFEIEINGKKEKVKAGECYIITDYVFFERNVITPISFVYIQFTNDQACSYSLKIPNGKITFKDKNRFLKNITAIENLLESDNHVDAGYKEHLFMDILFQIHYEQTPMLIPSEKEQYGDALVMSAIDYMRKNLDKSVLIEDICSAVGTNPSTLNYKFRRNTSMSIGKFMTMERMKKARHLLVSTSYNVSEIATRCGFENVYYFSTAFKNFYGITPSNFRKK